MSTHNRSPVEHVIVLMLMTHKQQTTHPETHVVKLPAYVEAAIQVFNNNQSFQLGRQS